MARGSNVEDHQVSFSLEVNVEKAYEDIRRYQTALYRTLSLLRRATGSEVLDEAMMKMQRAIAVANQLRLTLAALQTARLASGDPIAWIMFGVSAGTAVLDASDLIMEG